MSVSAISEKLHISRSTLYSYLRHRGVEIGAYQTSARSRDQQPTALAPAEPPATERVATVTLRLAVANNSKFVRGRKRATENIERYCLTFYGMKRLETGHYELSIPYRSDAELDKTVQDLLTEISQEADMRNCFVEMDAWEEGTERRW
ncbi:TnpR [Pseudomonas putida]|uniref:TnpR n=1 Tax=Pseudomonas putida ND6 TaxID=231023 RepID=I3UT34_PSEPU|nr:MULTISPECIES: TnpR [Pseudomonas]AFK68655.1 TnpR [Pseudomonas putida ND6]